MLIIQNSILSFTGSFRDNALENGSNIGTFNSASDLQWIQADGVNIESGLLASQWLTSNNWYSFFTSFKLEGTDFQSIQIKPYIQTAQLGNQILNEFGGFVDYLVDLGEVTKTHIGIGLSKDFLLANTSTNEFIQCSEFFDELGSIKGDVTVRWDFSNSMNTNFSLLMGGQYLQGNFTFLGDYEKDVYQPLEQNIQQGDLGIRLYPDETWSVTGKYQYVEEGNQEWNGIRIQALWTPMDNFIGIFKKLHFQFDEEGLADDSGNITYDSGCKLSFSFFDLDKIWIEGRGYSDQFFYNELGMDYSLSDQLKVFAVISNASNNPVSWPDPYLTSGRNWSVGIRSQF